MIPDVSLEWMFKMSGGVRVTSGGDVTWGHLDTIDFNAFGGSPAEVKGATHTLAIETGKITVVTNGTAITVDGDDYTIRDHNRMNDGKETQLLLKGA